MRVIRIAAVLLCAGLAGQAQLTSQQKITDLQSLAANFAKRYAPYEWKMEVYGADALKLQPFLERAAATRTDQEFYDVCYDYVSQFHDAHVALLMPSDFYARLGFSVDVYDGRVVIESITRTALPKDAYPFEVGDELVSLDGRTAEEWIETLDRYTRAAEPRGSRRLGAAAITQRAHNGIPTTARLGDTATVVIQRRNGGALETYTLPWIKTGTALADAGPVPDTTRTPRTARKAAAGGDPFGSLRHLMYSGVRYPRSLIGLGQFQPIFALPSDFKRHRANNFYAGSYQSGGKTIGFIRIPDFEPGDIDEALQELDTEIAWMQANTDGLILDVTHNPGGYVDYQTEISRRLIARPFRPIGHEMRATRDTVSWFTGACSEAKWMGVPEWKLAHCQAMANDAITAYRENRGRTGPLPLDFLFLADEDVPVLGEIPPAKNVYTKPIMALIDELSFSSADALPAVLQDNQAATLFGYRTAGAGGTVTSYQATTYSEFTIYLTVGLMARSKTVLTPDFPATNYVENVGVRPDIEEDYQTMDNLLNKGKTYVEHFTAAMVAAMKR